MDNDDKTLQVQIIEWIIIIIVVTIFLLPEIGQWAMIAGLMCDFFDIDYSKYDHFVPFVYMYDGENVSVPIVVGVIIVVLLVLAFIYGGGNVPAYVFILEIFAPVLAGYVIIWVAGVYLILKLFGVASSKWIALIVVIVIHILLFYTAKIATHVIKLLKESNSLL